MKKSLLYAIFYIMIIYGVYFISNFLEFAGGFISFIYTIAFWLLFILLFIFLGFRFPIISIQSKILNTLLLLAIALIPIATTILGFNLNYSNCESRLNKLGTQIEKYYLNNGKYPKSIDDVSTPISRFIESPYILLPFPRYYYETDSLRQQYSIHVYEDWDGGHMISSKYKRARWFE